jgi:serine/threonine protein kinase
MELTGIIIIACIGFCFGLCGVYAIYKRFQAAIEKKRLHESRKNWKLKHRNTLTGNFVMTYHMAVDEMYQFRDQSLLGKGSYGVVVVGVHKETKVEYAIKLVNTETGKRHRIEREYKLLKDIDHPNIVRLFAVYDTPREVSFVMELCTGGHLGNLLDRAVITGGATLPEYQSRSIIRQLLSAVAHMHGRGICHRDIKLQNIMLENIFPHAQIKIIDFGLGTRFIGATPIKTRCGTLYSTAPEVLRESYDEKCDIWSCGVVTFILLSGRKPFEALVLPTSGDRDGKCSVMTNILMNRLHYKQKNWKKISSDGLAFTQEMLQHNYKIRWSALEALEHKWLKDSTGQGYDFKPMMNNPSEEMSTQGSDFEILPNGEFSSLKPRKFSSGSVMSEASVNGMEGNLVQLAWKNMKRQADTSVLHQTSMLAMAYTMPHAQAANRRAFFQNYDADKNGVLSHDEFRNAMKACNIFASQTGETEPLNDEDIDRIFAAVDVNGDGQISFTEFLAATLDPRDYDIHALNTAFQLLDVDQKGSSFSSPLPTNPHLLRRVHHCC